MAKINNVTRFLDSRKVDYSVFELPPEKLGAIETAQCLGVDPDTVFKTIVITREVRGKAVLVLMPGTAQVDLKKVAAFLGEKKVNLPTEREAERLTGLQSGGISPLALLHKGFQVLLDLTVRDFSAVHISGGQRGLTIRMPVAELIRLTAAKVADFKREPLHKKDINY